MDYKSKIREMVKEELLKFLEGDAEKELEKRTPIGDLPRRSTMGSVSEEEDESLCEEEAIDEEEEKLSAFQKALRRRQAMSDAYDKRMGIKRSPTTTYSVGGGKEMTKPNPSYKPDA